MKLLQRQEALRLPKFKPSEPNPNSLAPSCSNSLDEIILHEARQLLALGIQDNDLATFLLHQAVNVEASPGLKPYQRLNGMIAAIHGLGPKDELESMLAVQMVTVHNLAMEFMKRSICNNGMMIDPADAETNRAVRLMRVFMDQIDALNRYRGKGQQNIVVEHVNVNSGGQAIVGSVQPSGKGEGVDAKK